VDEIEFYLEDLKSKFAKIRPENYYLSYSGGRDSHFLYWFIKEYLKEDRIEIVSLNTGMELEEIRNRMMQNSDRILHPTMKPFDIKEKYGIPCVTKHQDEFVYQYRKQLEKGKITSYIEELVVNSKTSKSYYRINNKLHDALFSGTLHKISHLCCKYLKKEPAKNYEKESGKLPIIGIMGEESLTRKAKITSCFNQKKYFYPIWDLTNELQKQIEGRYEIEVPKIYNFLHQTGCAGCPYGFGKNGKNTQIELSLLKDKQRDFIMQYFKESYDYHNFVYDYKLFY
jgi:3'-phosphoadenosine 5'-phosphosulfate sulfotransferase (PAPS reductase)/FAD synthetase